MLTLSHNQPAYFMAKSGCVQACEQCNFRVTYFIVPCLVFSAFTVCPFQNLSFTKIELNVCQVHNFSCQTQLNGPNVHMKFHLNFFYKCKYRKVAIRSTSRLVAHPSPQQVGRRSKQDKNWSTQFLNDPNMFSPGLSLEFLCIALVIQ